MNTDAGMRRLSWRDPQGFVVCADDRIYRAIQPTFAPLVRELLVETWVQALIARGQMPASKWLDNGPQGYPDAATFVWLEHEEIRFPGYAHKITAAQLHDAAMLTLDIAENALANGWLLKDASAWNILFQHGKPIFCDILSFEPCANQKVWPAYAQFCRHFIIPLMLHKTAGIEPAWYFLTHRDGVPPEMARPMLKGIRAWLQPTLEVVTLPTLLSGKSRAASRRGSQAKPASAALSHYLLSRIFGRLRKHLRSVKPEGRSARTAWGAYEEERTHYSADDLQAKRGFVKRALDDQRIHDVLDLGCNAGEFSKLAASMGKRVAAADFDHGALTRLYRQVREGVERVHPFVLNVARPTPAVGWMNAEIPSFLDRAKGQFDCVMALGLLHHLIVSEGLSLYQLRDFFLKIGPRDVILEWICPDDVRFLQIAARIEGGRLGCSERDFESVFGSDFDLVAKESLSGGTRIMYHWKRQENG